MLSLLAIGIAIKLERNPLFERVSFVISDEISRRLGMRNTEHVVLVRLDRSLAKPDLQSLLSAAIPILVHEYGVSAVGVDIDFSRGGYDALASKVASWETEDSETSRKTVWAVGYENGSAEPPMDTEAAFCESCAKTDCRTRFVPKSVFGGDRDPSNYGLAIAFPDLDGVNRRSGRFVCHSQTQSRLATFHFKLVELYCATHPDLATCRDLSVNAQAPVNIYSWYKTEPEDLCKLWSCEATHLGARTSQRFDDLAHKIVILYSDVPSDDEHPTMVNTKKGAEILASLIENELEFGVLPESYARFSKWSSEALLTLLLIFLFNWPRTEHWAIIIATGLFAMYVRLIPSLASWVPDFRHYALGIILAFWIEVLVKSAWHNLPWRGKVVEVLEGDEISGD
jgi:hypothetical protein